MQATVLTLVSTVACLSNEAVRRPTILTARTGPPQRGSRPVPMDVPEKARHARLVGLCGWLDDELFGPDDRYRPSRLVIECYFKDEERWFNLFAIHNDVAAISQATLE